MVGLVSFLHVVVCLFLALVILMQAGRGGGLTEGFASAESMFGAKTNVFMVRATTVLTCIFIFTCLTLAYSSSKKDRSLMSDRSLMGKSVPANATPDKKNSNAHAVMETKETEKNANQDKTTVPEAGNSGAPSGTP